MASRPASPSLRSGPLAIMALLLMALWPASPTSGQERREGGRGPPVLVLEVRGAIGPATTGYLQRGLQRAAELSAAMVVLRMDTPGGLDTAMREIIRAVLASPVPVATWVAPGGARAASAGTYILYASHVAAMAPATNLGAATPIPLGGSTAPAGDDEAGTDAAPGAAAGAKAVNDAAAYIRGLAELRGRNAAWAERAVREAVSLSAPEALRQEVIDLVAADLHALLRQADGREVTAADVSRRLDTADAPVIELAPNWRERLLAAIANPNVAYLLLLIGVYGIVFELASPGTLVGGIVGVVSLLLGLFALNLLPISGAGAALLLLGVALMAAEAFTPSFGVLGLGGAGAFAIGSLMLFDTDAPGFAISTTLVGAVTSVTLVLLSFVLTIAVRSHRGRIVTGGDVLIGAVGEVLGWSGGRGEIRVNGECWSALADAPLQPGQRVRVTSRDSLTLRVRAETDPSA